MKKQITLHLGDTFTIGDAVILVNGIGVTKQGRMPAKRCVDLVIETPEPDEAETERTVTSTQIAPILN